MKRKVFQIAYGSLFVVLLGSAITEILKDDPNIVMLNLWVLAFVAQLAVAGYVLSRQSRLAWYWREFAALRHELTGAFILTSLLLFLVTIPGEHKVENQLKQMTAVAIRNLFLYIIPSHVFLTRIAVGCLTFDLSPTLPHQDDQRNRQRPPQQRIAPMRASNQALPALLLYQTIQTHSVYFHRHFTLNEREIYSYNQDV